MHLSYMVRPMDDEEALKRTLLKRRLLKIADENEETEPDLAGKLRAKTDEIVNWFFEHRREMTLGELEEILGGSGILDGSGDEKA